MTLVLMSSADSALTAFMPSGVIGILTTMCSLKRAKVSPAGDHLAALVRDHLGAHRTANDVADLLQDRGIVVPVFLRHERRIGGDAVQDRRARSASRISSMFAVSRKISCRSVLSSGSGHGVRPHLITAYPSPEAPAPGRIVADAYEGQAQRRGRRSGLPAVALHAGWRLPVPGSIRPRPTSISVPAMTRTIWWTKRVASTAIVMCAPSRATASPSTRHTFSASLMTGVKLVKSCSPTRCAPAAAMRSTSNAWCE